MSLIVLRQIGHKDGAGATLAKALGVRSIYPGLNISAKARKRLSTDDVVLLNWGVTAHPEGFPARSIRVLNSFDAVRTASNKLACFAALQAASVPCVEWTTDRETAAKWVSERTVFVRTVLSGSGGTGIVLVDKGSVSPMPKAPLYTANFRKDAEFRVHVAANAAVFVQQKRRMNSDRRAEMEDAVGRESYMIRNHDNGWVFAENDLDCDRQNFRALLEHTACTAVSACGLWSGAVDLLVRLESSGPRVVVCEVNSAPGIRSTRLCDAYCKEIRRWLGTKK